MQTTWDLWIEHHWIYQQNPTDPITALTEGLGDLAQATEQVLLVGKQKSGPRTQTHIQRTVDDLANLYEEFTGERFSHNPKDKTDYDGRPHSRAGRFIVAFFEIVDPKVPQTSLSTAIASIVKARRTVSSDQLNLCLPDTGANDPIDQHQGAEPH
jgi:hypothetical protein